MTHIFTFDPGGQKPSVVLKTSDDSGFEVAGVDGKFHAPFPATLTNATGLTGRERLVLEKGISNQEYHYLGSAKILGGIGKGLAEALAELKKAP